MTLVLVAIWSPFLNPSWGFEEPGIDPDRAPTQSADVRPSPSQPSVSRSPVAASLAPDGTEPEESIPSDTSLPSNASIPSDAAGLPADSHSPSEPSGESDAVVSAASQKPIIEPLSFKAVQPGVTTVDQVVENWGQPLKRQQQDGSQRLSYEFAPFRHISVTARDSVVVSVVVDLQQSFEAESLAQELGLDSFDPLEVRDRSGQALGQAFPERGVLFVYVEGELGNRVGQVMLERIDPRSFVLRAESRHGRMHGARMTDLGHALRFAPNDARAHWRMAQVQIELGQLKAAAVSIQRARHLEPKNAEYLLTQAALLDREGAFNASLDATQKALAESSGNRLLQAKSLALLGELISIGPKRDDKAAADHEMAAIKLARPLLESQDARLRDEARQLLFDAHLTMARIIAWGAWKRKPEVVPKWIDRASEYAERDLSMPASSESPGEPTLAAQFDLARARLEVLVALNGAIDPNPTEEEALRLGRELIQSGSDPLERLALEWRLGIALYDAMQIYHVRSEYEPALKSGTLASEYLMRSERLGLDLPGTRYMLGRLNFRLGSIHALHYKDHQRAIPWFRNAVDLLSDSPQHGGPAELGRRGETLVSMAVSYWEVGQREEAIRLTEQGLAQMEQSVTGGGLQREALSVPYSNLAQMHRGLGHSEKARNFQQLAARSEGTPTRR
jgi:tetratricopeptide (TPR) repeat protein